MTLKDRFTTWLGCHFPEIHKHTQQLWRKARGRSGYWEKRLQLKYYDEVIRLAKEYSSGQQSIIDVGASDTQLLSKMHWFQRRVALDIRYSSPRDGIENVVCDFISYIPDEHFDMVLCLQVLEHLENPAEFAQKLFQSGQTVIISVPYKWPSGIQKNHVQDPVDEQKLKCWTGRDAIELLIVCDRRERLIAVYQPQ